MKTPYGYFRDEDDTTDKINPCFFLKFETNNFVNLSEEAPNYVKCKAELVLDRPSLYDLLFKLDRDELSHITQEYMEYITDNKEILRKIALIEESEIERMLKQKKMIEGLKVIKEMEKDQEKFHMFKEYLFTNGTELIRKATKVGDNVEAIKLLNMLPNEMKERKDDIIRNLIDSQDTIFGYDEIIRLYGYEKKFFQLSDNISNLVTDLRKNKEIMSDPDIFKVLEDHFEVKNEKDAKDTLKKLINFKDHFYIFAEIDRDLRKIKLQTNNLVPIKIFPLNGSIPSQYFPMDGTEESPLVALKVLLEENVW